MKEERFKLIAIRPLKDCDVKFKRVLKEGRVYPFYSNYKFEYEDEEDILSDIIKVQVQTSVADELYDLPNVNINVSAIIGKNGTGKSTLIELFFAAIYNLAISQKKLKPNHDTIIHEKYELMEKKIDLDIRRESLMSKQKTIVDLYKKLRKQKLKEVDYRKLRRALEESLKEKETINEEEGDLAEDELLLDESFNEIERLATSIKVEIYYELNNEFFLLQIGKNNSDINDVVLTKFVPVKKNPDELKPSQKKYPYPLGHFFYSIAISYSHYALNAKVVGSWVNSLFHKNDGYQTPLVINPMRTNGNIDINTENELVLQRVLVNILEETGGAKPIDTLRHLAPNKVAETLILTFDSDKIDTYRQRQIKSKKTFPNADFLNKLCLEYVGTNVFYVNHGDQVFEALKIYIENKIIKICEQYDRYKRFVKKGDFIGDDKLINLICKDNSHITFKLKQALNFLIHAHYPINDQNKELKKPLDFYTSCISSVKEDAETLGKKPTTIELLPPPIFKINVKMEDGTDMEDLSSGEKQQIHSTSSIVYHLINLNSVSDNGEDRFFIEATTVQNYNYVNILFDEAEQYFHPDLQRTFLSDLLDYISKINPKNLEHIIGINMLFVSHSPFILSDILNSNCLFLELDDDNFAIPNEYTRQSFGANINDMLKRNFFMTSSLGEFARKKVSQLIQYYKRAVSMEDELIEGYKEQYAEKRNGFVELIKLIEEPVSKGILQNHLSVMDKRFLGLTDEERIIQKRISQLEQELEKIKSQKKK